MVLNSDSNSVAAVERSETVKINSSKSSFCKTIQEGLKASITSIFNDNKPAEMLLSFDHCNHDLPMNESTVVIIEESEKHG